MYNEAYVKLEVIRGMHWNKMFKERLLCVTPKYMLCYYKGEIIIRNTLDLSIAKTRRVHPRYKSVSLVERMLRHEIRTAISLSDDVFLFADRGKIVRYDVEQDDYVIEHEFDRGMNSPLQFCIRYDEYNNVEVLYGEYIWNERKGPVAIYKRDGNEWGKVFEFPENTVTHIHNIMYDGHRNRYIILTGDDDDESGIWQADCDFKNVMPIVIGKQSYRACVSIATEDGVYYVTDTPLETNYIYKLIEKNDEVSVDKIAKVAGPCIYGVCKDSTLYFATSVEGDPSQNKWRYRLSQKLGKGVSDWYIHIYRFSCDRLEEIGKYKKDILPMWLFQFGNALFTSTSDKEVFIYLQSSVTKGTFKVEDEHE